MKKEDVLSKIKIGEFCNLHGHSTYSMGDAIGHANEIVDSVIDNHMNSVAISDHGNMNVIGDFYKYSRKLEDKGIDFKPIFANEFYFIPSLKEWQLHKDHKSGIVNSEEAQSLSEKYAEYITSYSENHFEHLESKKKGKIKSTATIEVTDETDEDDDSSVVEDEKESKFSKDFSPIKRRHHLVLMAMNEQGLSNLLRLNGEAQENGFYMKPRIDFELIEKYNKGIVCTSACISGDANVKTKSGTLKMKKIVDMVKSGIDVEVLAHDESEGSIKSKKVLWADCTRKKSKVFKLKLKNGKELKLTDDHKVYTQRGWVEVKSLNKSDKILSIK
jgi:DNA polymerase III alpha subunit